MSNRRVFVVAAITVGLLVPLGLLAGTGFAKGSPSSAQYQYGGKVALCHHTHSKKHPFHTINVDAHALKAHLRHGDTMGACSQSASTTSHGKGKHGNSQGDDNDQGHGNKP